MPPPSGRASAEALESLLESLLVDLGAQLRRGAQIEARGSAGACAGERDRRCATGIPAVDRLLGGGLPRGRLCEIVGPPSSGRTSLALGLLAAATRAGECAAWVDCADALDPPSAAAAGADLDRVLWVRASGRRDALRSTERLLQTDGFAIVILDTTGAAQPRWSSADWLRLARLAAGASAALVLLGEERCAGSSAAIALALEPGAVRFAGTPSLLEGLEIRVRLARHRTAPADRAIAVRLRTTQAA
jgi:hypothetical protein